ncbi:response regulator [Amycolatopsis sp. NPDC051128]|uniref:hybrid sensor histidine kinase/response regulator n=1 Tax=Amycolatopsis sp. NPDC051128 TaxID=3155412 RepID=UPI00343FC799
MAALSIHQVRTLFVQEAEGRLAHLDKLLLELEQANGDQELIDSVFRELHTIKGSSAVAGLDEVSRLAHDLEDLLGDARAGQRATTPDVIDALLTGTDRLRALIPGDGDGGAEAGAGAGAGPSAAATAAGADGGAGASAHAPVRDVRPVRQHSADSGQDRVQRTGDVVMVSMERLDELIRLVGESASAHLRVGRMLQNRFNVDPASVAEFDKLSRSLNDLQDRAMRTRMVPVATITDQLHRAVRDLARAESKDVRWEVRGVDTELDRGVLHELSDALLHVVRNAVDHGIEPPAERAAAGKPAQGTIRLHAMQLGSEVIIAVTDDGLGIDLDRVRRTAARHGIDTEGMEPDDLYQLIFRSGLSTASFVTDVSGRGVGLDVVRANVEAARGRVEVRSEPGGGTEIRIIVPITLAVLRCLLVEVSGQRFALPFHRVVSSQNRGASGELHAEGRPAVWVDRRSVPVSALADILANSPGEPAAGPIVVLADASRRHGFQVDRLVGQRDVVLKGLGRLVPHVPAVAGASVEPDGSVLIVLDPPGLIQRARAAGRVDARPAPTNHADTLRQRILVVDDALTVRELQRSILERAGFDVRVATDGVQALSSLAEHSSDLVLTDIEMPNMDGFALTEAIRAKPSLANIPVLILSSRSSDADRQRGLDVGADGYLLKSGFDQSNLVTAVNRLLGVGP